MSYKALNLPDQVRGDTWNFKFVFEDSAGSAIDISNNEYWFTLKSNLNQLDAEAELQVGPFSPDPAEALLGTLVLTVSPDLTESLPIGYLTYDLQEITSTNKVTTVLLGKVKVSKDVTLTANYSGVSSSVVYSSRAGTAIYTGTTSTDQYDEIYLDGVNNTVLELQDDSTLSFTALVAGKDTIVNTSCAFSFEGALEKEGANTTILGGVGKFILGKEDPLFDANIEADNVNGGLKVSVKAASSNSTRWIAKINYTEVSY